MIGWRRPRGYRHFLFFCNFVAVKRRRCRGYFATALRLVGGVAAVSRQLRCGYTVNLAALPRLFGITLAVMRLFAAVIGGVGIQPERLNAEGFSPSALSRGWSVSVTLGMPGTNGKASGGRESCRRGSRYSRLSDASNGVT